MTTETSIERRATSASIAGLVSTGIAVLLQLVTVPVVLTYWGSETYGVWLAVMAGFMMLRTVEGGYVAYIGNRLNAQYHESRDSLRHTLGSSFWICAGLGLIQISLCVGLLATGSEMTMLGTSASTVHGSEAGVALTIVLLAWVLTCSFPALVNRLLVPAGLLSNAIWWGLAFQVTQLGVIMVAALRGMSILQTAIIFAGAQSSVYLASAIYVYKKLPDFFPWWKGARLSTGFRDLSRSAILTASSVAHQARLSGIVLIVSSFLGAAMVPAFTTARTLANLGNTLGGVFANALSPELVRYFVTGQYEKLTIAFRANALFGGLAVNLSMLVILSSAETIYTVWTNGKVPFVPQLFFYLVAGVSAWSAGWTYTNFLTVINSVNMQLLLTLVRACAALGLGVALTGPLGLAGVAVGVLIGEAIASWLATFVLVPRLIASRSEKLPRSVQMEGFLISLPVVAITLFGALSGTLPGQLILAATIGLLLFGWYAWLRLPQEARVRVGRIVLR